MTPSSTVPSALNAWVLAARPKTLAASLSPVMVGSALAYRHGDFDLVPALLCLLVALFAQIASNFANDYFDFKKGADNDNRVGQPRAVASGWIRPAAMLNATLAMLGATALCGFGLLFYGGWELIAVGVAVMVGVVAYSAGPYPLAYRGWGDVCVLVFYGIIPLCFTYYIQTGIFDPAALWLSVAVGLQSVNILLVNNYRDREQDRAAGKQTTVVRFGPHFARIAYVVNIVLAHLCAFPIYLYRDWNSRFLFLFFFIIQLFTWQDMMRAQGSALNKVLELTARNVLFFALLLTSLLLF